MHAGTQLSAEGIITVNNLLKLTSSIACGSTQNPTQDKMQLLQLVMVLHCLLELPGSTAWYLSYVALGRCCPGHSAVTH